MTNRTPLPSSTACPLPPCGGGFGWGVRAVEIIGDSHTRRALTPLPSPPPQGGKGQNRRARFAVVGGVVGFVLLQASLNAAITRDLLPVRDPVYAEKFALLAAHPAFFAPRSARDPQRVLALGSSRTQMAVNATLLGDERTARGIPTTAFNFGTPAGGAITSNLYLRRAFAAGLSADIVLVEVHPCFTAAPPPGEAPFEGRWLHEYRLRHGEVETLATLGYARDTPPHLGWKGYVSASYSYRLPFLSRYAERWLLCPYGLALGGADGRGFVRGLVPGSAAERVRFMGMAWQQYDAVLPNYRVGGPGAEAVRDAVRVCRAHGATPIVVVSPEADWFRAWYGDAGNADIRDFVDELRSRSRVIDARAWLPAEAFADGHHMTPAGADEYTRRLAAEVGR